MLKYYDYAIVFAEIPDEITLALNITNCPNHCINCHSPWLREDIGTVITPETIKDLIEKNSDISCICFMGGDKDHKSIQEITDWVHKNFNIKVAMYSGDDIIDNTLLQTLDYYKVGSYQEQYGPLNKRTTNQILYKNINGQIEDITYKFWH